MTQPPHRTPIRSARRSGEERQSRERRVLALGLALSLVAHLVVLLVVGSWLAPRTGPVETRPARVIVEPPQGMRVVELRARPDAAVPEDPDAPERPDPEPERAPTREVRLAETPPDTLPADARTAADRLTPRVVDPRLWQPMILIPREPTFAEVEARVAAAVELLSDSALAAADAAIRSRDWTVADGKGGKWGVSPGKIHLGSLVLPLPIYAVASPDQVAEQAVWLELDQQLERALILESFEERVRAIRARRERERRESRAGDNGGG